MFVFVCLKKTSFYIYFYFLENGIKMIAGGVLTVFSRPGLELCSWWMFGCHLSLTIFWCIIVVLQEVSWPIHEFGELAEEDPLLHLTSELLPVNWNDPLYLDEAIQAIDGLRLEVPEVLASDRWQDVLQQVWAYVDSLASPDLDSSVLVSEIRLRQWFKYEYHQSWARDICFDIVINTTRHLVRAFVTCKKTKLKSFRCQWSYYR